jgi:DNA-binding transcriptional ArsR family regulator
VLDSRATRHVTTSELARQAGISTASASEHASVLRRAGLITSHRDEPHAVPPDQARVRTAGNQPVRHAQSAGIA